MNILVVCQYYYPENFVISKFCDNFVKQGHKVTVLTAKPNYGYGHILPEYKKINFEVINGVNVHRVNVYPRNKNRLSIIRNYLSFWRNSKKWVRKCKEKFDVVYSMSLSPVTILAAGNLYKKKHNVPHVVHCVDLWPESVLITHAVRKKSLIYKMLYKWSKKLYACADHILVGSPSYKSYFKEVLKITNIPLDFVPQTSLMEQSDIEPYNYDKEKFNILYCGNLGLIQQIDLIPEAVKKLDNNVVFHVIGMGPMSQYLENKIKEYQLENRLIYHGPIPAKKAVAYFKSADALYVSLKGEGYVGKTIPNKLMMSMAFKKPVLAMLEGDGKDVLLQAGGGIFVEQNHEDLLNKIKTISKLSKDELNKMGQLNNDYYQNHFSHEAISKQILTYLQSEITNKI